MGERLMPRFKTFDAPDKAFSEDSTGFSAFETAGRRVGPLYNQAGQDLRGAGQAGVNAAEAGVRGARDALGLAESNTRLSEDQLRQQREGDRQGITDRTWPFDVAALQARSGSSRGGGGSGNGIALRGSVNPEINNSDGGYANDRGSRDRSYSPGRASHAAAGLGQLASGLAQRAPYAARQDITNGQITYDSRNPRAFAQPTTYLDHGVLRRVGSREGPNPNEPADLQRYSDAAHAAGPFDTTTGQPVGPDFVGGGGDPGARDTYAGPEGNISVPEGYDGSADYGGGGDSNSWWNGTTSSVASTYRDAGGGGDNYGEE
jgi:hypothetical protein